MSIDHICAQRAGKAGEVANDAGIGTFARQWKSREAGLHEALVEFGALQNRNTMRNPAARQFARSLDDPDIDATEAPGQRNDQHMECHPRGGIGVDLHVPSLALAFACSGQSDGIGN